MYQTFVNRMRFFGSLFGVLALASLAVESLDAQLINIDLAASSQQSPGTSGHAVGAGIVGGTNDIWIETGYIPNPTVNNPTVLMNIKDSTGHATGVTFSADFQASWTGASPVWASAPDGAASALSEGVSYIRGIGARKSTFGGLVPSALFNIYLIDLNGGDQRATDFTINGVTQTVKTPNAYGAGWAEGIEYVVFKSVPADAKGRITIEVSSHSQSAETEADVSGIQLQAAGGAGPFFSAPDFSLLH